MKGKFIVFPEIGDIVEFTPKPFYRDKVVRGKWRGPTRFVILEVGEEKLYFSNKSVEYTAKALNSDSDNRYVITFIDKEDCRYKVIGRVDCSDELDG